MLVPPVPGQLVIALADARVVVQPKHHDRDQNQEENDDCSNEQSELHDLTVRTGRRGTGNMRPLDTS
jgi:hypothetical protein